MKIYEILIGFITFCVSVYGGIYMSHLETNHGSPISVYEVEKGVKCAMVTKTDVAAISCWKE